MEEEKAKKALIRLLARRSWFSQELLKNLLQKGFAIETVKKILTEAKAAGYLNDEELAERYVKNLKQKGYGKKYIMQKLHFKAGNSFLYHWKEENAIQAIHQVIQRRYIKQLASKDPKVKNKIIAALVRKGFELEEIFSSLKDY